MAKTTSQVSKKGFFTALIGTVLVAICCFTPILVVLFSAVGFSAFTPYLDWVLLPAFVIMIVLTILSYRRWRSTAKNHS